MSGPQRNLTRRAEYTFKHNLKTGRHGWLRLTPAYSVVIVEELIAGAKQPLRVLDPFSGTATTALCAAYHGHEGVTTDINPFLVWFGRAKTAYYPAETICTARDAVSQVTALVEEKGVEPVPPPPIHNIERWWSAPALEFLCAVRAAIDAVTEPGSQERDLLLVAFCRTLITLSNAAFNHQSMSFKGEGEISLDLEFDMGSLFAREARFVLEGAKENPRGNARVILWDARDVGNVASVVGGQFDRVITSPPYANRMSYIRELRPYMYWLGFLTSGRDAGELDWQAIGGTWGAATSRLSDWKPSKHTPSGRLDNVLQQIASDENKNGRLLANYVARYFEDMTAHFEGLLNVLAPGAELHYIVGNSAFYGVVLPVQEVYADILRSLGFRDVACRPIRKRNSKKELVEFDVVATWPG